MYAIDKLNQKFGAPGRIAFRLSESSGRPMVALVNSYGHCEISLCCGQVLSYRPTGHVPVLFTRRGSVNQAKRMVCDGASICWPWLGAPPAPDLPTDGFARLVEWNILATEYNSQTTEISLYLADTEETRAWWPHSFELVQKITLGDHLAIELTTRNTGEQPFAISQSIRPCFKVRDITQVSISGVENCNLTNPLTKEQAVQQGPLTITQKTHHIYTGVPDACVICDKGLGRNIAMTYSNAKNLIVCNPSTLKSDGSEESSGQELKSVIIAAPVTLPEDNIILQPGGLVSLQTSIQATLT